MLFNELEIKDIKEVTTLNKKIKDQAKSIKYLYQELEATKIAARLEIDANLDKTYITPILDNTYIKKL
jgi:hypothetical protein